jgi:DNA gyrase/topoisomerase IV subunit B
MAAPRNVEQLYKKHELRDHIYKLPDTYIGSVEATPVELYMYDDDAKRMQKKVLNYVPGLYKIFDEVTVNALDHAMRLKKSVAEKVSDVRPLKAIRISVDKETGWIEITNDGDGIHIEEHPVEKMYVPQLIFGNLLTSTNYDEKEEKLWGGKNGYGAKLTNIFSKEFIIETVDHRSKKIYTQRFFDNMKSFDKPSIKACSKAPYTKIRFLPDYNRFGMRKLSEDMYDIFRKRAFDACATTDPTVSVYFNDAKLDIKSFERYADLYLGAKDETPRAYEACGERWEVIATFSPNGQFEQVSFTNGINTIRGGKHVEYITNQITKRLADMASSKTKRDVKQQYIKDNLMVFVKCLVVNPSFDTQTKEALTTPASKFGSKCDLSDKFFASLYKTGITEKAISLTEFHDTKKLAKTDGKKTSRVLVPKLDDANWAGTKKSAECTLILTEGDSSRTMAIAGLSVVGRDKYGVFPLRGKILNVKDAQLKKIQENEEIANLKKILGLQHGKEYKDASELRYGRIMVMTDQDSVSGDTPLLLRNPEGQVEIRSIDDISYDWEQGPLNSEKDYSTTAYEVWTEKGWTSIKHVMRHKTTKRMYRVLTHTGCVDVTEDHSLLNKNGEKITPGEVEIGDELLHSFPEFAEHASDIPNDLDNLQMRTGLWDCASQNQIQYYQLKSKTELITELKNIQAKRAQIGMIEPYSGSSCLTLEEAYVMGLFWADGNCGFYGKNKEPVWCIVNTDLSFIQKAKSFLENTYPHVCFSIYTTQPCEEHYKIQYKLSARGGKAVTTSLVEKYRALFYDNRKSKCIPAVILNASHDIRKQFFEGFYDGDGAKTSGTKFDVADKIGAMGLFYLCKSLGYHVSLNHNETKQRVYRITLTPANGKQQRNPNVIKKILDLGVTEQYVYDLETENHHFHAGVGQMIVHNTDGFHIKGLLFNVFQSIWPTLFQNNGFLTCMLTPIMKATHAKGGTMKFYSITDFDNWKKVMEQSPGGMSGWKIKYYKGLGTSSEAEAKEYFQDMKQVTYTYDGKKSDEALDLAFNKKRADDRKDWLMRYRRENILDYNQMKVPYEEFVHKELIHFSNRDLERSINHLCDGLKESTRKIMFGCFKRKLYRDEIKVAQLAAYISEISAYHHGEASLQQAITGMAQVFVGTNNINLLVPKGQFGTRIQGGQDAASPRYIFTLLSRLAKTIFREEDEAVLRYLNDDGMMVEPEYYIPIVPMILINGGLGIGTGFSTNVPSHNPSEVAAQCERIAQALEKEVGAIETKEQLAEAARVISKVKLSEMVPWYLGFQGKIVPHKEGSYASKGIYRWVDDQTIEVTELPLGTWTDDYKDMLTSMITNGSIYLKDFESHYTAKTVRFLLKLHPNVRESLEKNVETEFKLVSTKNLSLNNIHLYSAQGAVQRFKDTHEVIKAWAVIRLEKYLERKHHQLKTMEHEFKMVSAKVRFIQDIIDGKLVINNKKIAELEDYLRAHKFPQSKSEEENSDSTGTSGYAYLTRMPIYSLTYEKKKELDKEANDLKMKIDDLRAKPITTIWQSELKEFHEAWDSHRKEIEEEYAADMGSKPAAAKRKMVVKKK